ncbi:unnamed protein product [Arctogadus glacialis]
MAMFINGASEEAGHGWFMGLKQCDDQRHVSLQGTTHHNKQDVQLRSMSPPHSQPDDLHHKPLSVSKLCSKLTWPSKSPHLGPLALVFYSI